LSPAELARPPARRAPEVVVYGTVCLDRFVRVDASGEPLDDAVTELPGGEALNTATQLAGWGVRVVLTGTALGPEPEADRLRTLLDTHPLGLPRDHIPDDPNAVTPSCTIRVFPDGERTMRGKGFAQAVAPAPLPDAVLSARPVFAACPNLGRPAVLETLRAASFGCPVVAMDMAHLPEVAAVARVVVTSRDAFPRFFGDRAAGLDPEALIRELLALGCPTAIVTLGAEGCLVADRDEGAFTVPAFRVPDIVDTTGAGDAFRAGLCYGLLHRLSTRETVRLASAAAARHCQRFGGGSRVPLEEIAELV
jgi:ribokinase